MGNKVISGLRTRGITLPPLLNSSYKDRDFEKNPLEDEEIDAIIKNIPSNKKLMSLDEYEKTKVLKVMSDEKIYNTVGDNIFDYHIQNNREYLRDCIRSHINRVGTPCPDKIFKRLITEVPGIFLDPVDEKIDEQISDTSSSLRRQFNKTKYKLLGQRNSLSIDLEDQRNKYTTDKGIWENEKSSLQNKNNSLSRDLEVQLNKYTTEKNTWNEEQQNLQSNYDDILSERNTLKTDYDTLVEDKDSLKKDYDDILAEKNTLSTNYNMLDSEKKSLVREKNRLEEEKNTLTEDYNELDTTHDALLATYNTLDENYNELSSDKLKLEREQKILEAEKENLVNKNAKLVTEKDDFKAIRDALVTEKNTLEEENSELITEKNELVTAKGELQEEKDNLKVEYDNLKENPPPLKAPKVIVTNDGIQDYSMSLRECQAYADENNLKFSKSDSNTTRVTGQPRFVEVTEGASSGIPVTKEQCTDYARTREDLTWSNDTFSNQGDAPSGCFIRGSKIFFNDEVQAGSSSFPSKDPYAPCSQESICVRPILNLTSLGGCSTSIYDREKHRRGVSYSPYNKHQNISCKHASNKGTSRCIKKWKDYKPDETDTSNFNPADYNQYSQFSIFMDKVKPLVNDDWEIYDRKKRQYRKLEDKDLADFFESDYYEYNMNNWEQYVGTFRRNISNFTNTNPISENECRKYAGENAAKYFVNNTDTLPRGCIKKLFQSGMEVHEDRDYNSKNKIMYNYGNEKPYQTKDYWGRGKRHGTVTNTIAKGDSNNNIVRENTEALEPRYNVIVKKPTWEKFVQDMSEEGLTSALGSITIDTDKQNYMLNSLEKATSEAKAKTEGKYWENNKVAYIYKESYENNNFPWIKMYNDRVYFNYKERRTGIPVGNIHYMECEEIPNFSEKGAFSDKPYGCYTENGLTYYNKERTDVECSNSTACLEQKFEPYDLAINGKSNENLSIWECHDFAKKTQRQFQDSSFGIYAKRVGKPDKSVSKEECKKFAEFNDLYDTNYEEVDDTRKPPGCIVSRAPRRSWVREDDGTRYRLTTNAGSVRWNKNDNDLNCQYHAQCVTKNNVSDNPPGCYINKKDGKKGLVMWNTQYDVKKGIKKGTANCTMDKPCVQINLNDRPHFDIDYFEESSKYAPDLHLNQKGCQEYATKHKKIWGGLVDKTEDVSGCYISDNKLYYNTNKNSNLCTTAKKCINQHISFASTYR